MTHTQAPADPSTALPSIERQVADAQSAWRAEARVLGKLATAFAPLARPAAYRDLAKLPKLLEKVEAKVRALPLAARGAAVLEGVRGDLAERRRHLHENLAKDLRAACEASKLELRVLRRDEPVEIRIPPFAVRIDREKGRADLRFARETVASCEADAAAILRTRARTLETMRRGFQAERFFDACLTAWRAACGAGKAGSGERVELLDFLPFLVVQLQPASFRVDPSERNFRAYSRAQFAFDLLQLRANGGLTQGGWRLNLGVATGTSATKKDRVIFVEDENGDGEFKLSVFFARAEVGR